MALNTEIGIRQLGTYESRVKRNRATLDVQEYKTMRNSDKADMHKIKKKHEKQRDKNMQKNPR